jgi:hypothetical protein
MKRPAITYVYRGDIERGTGGPGYAWHPGYSEHVEGGAWYPWMTRAECQCDARARGAVARFHDNRRPPLARRAAP